MDRIKAKINQLKEAIEACEERETEAKSRLNEANTRFEMAESERESFIRRLQIVEDDVGKINERLAEKQEKLDELESKTVADEHAVKRLENLEVEGDEKLLSFSEQVRRGQLEAEDYESQFREAIRKEIVVQRDLERVESKISECSLRITESMEIIYRESEEIGVLEVREVDQCKRESEKEEKLAFLLEQTKEALIRAENAERDVVRLDKVLDGLETDRKLWKDKTRCVLDEIEKMTDCLDEM